MTYLVDIVVAIQNLDDRYKLLKYVFSRLNNAGVKLYRGEFLFAQT